MRAAARPSQQRESLGRGLVVEHAERLRVEAHGGRQHLALAGLLGGRGDPAQRPLTEIGWHLADHPELVRQLDRLAVVMGELVDHGRLGEVVGVLLALDVLGDPRMPLGPVDLGDGLVRDLAHEVGAEPPEVAVQHQDLLGHQGGEQVVEPVGAAEVALHLAQPVDRTGAADDRGVLQGGERFGVEGIQAGGHQTPEGVGQLVDAPGDAAITTPTVVVGPGPDEGHQLFEEERVAAAAVDEHLDHRRRWQAAGQRFEQLLGRLAVQWIDVQDEVVVPAWLGRPALGDLWPGGGDDRGRTMVEAREQVVEQGQHAVVGPVDVGQLQQQRA